MHAECSFIVCDDKLNIIEARSSIPDQQIPVVFHLDVLIQSLDDDLVSVN